MDSNHLSRNFSCLHLYYSSQEFWVHPDIPEINNPKIRFPVLEGDKLMKEVLNGGYNVHPVPPPNSEIIERIKKRYETKRIKIEKLLTLGYTTSGDP